MNKRKKIITAAVALVITMCTCGAYPAAASDVIYSCQSSKKNIALTFDDGPHPVHTPEILDILAEYGIKATFFVIGENATWYGDLVKTEYESGHEIGNHTYSHHMNRIPNKAPSPAGRNLQRHTSQSRCRQRLQHHMLVGRHKRLGAHSDG